MRRSPIPASHYGAYGVSSQGFVPYAQPASAFIPQTRMSPTKQIETTVREVTEPFTPVKTPVARKLHTGDDDIVHDDITCNACRVCPIKGARYKCSVCPDFDLCADCEDTARHNPSHIFLKIRDSARHKGHILVTNRTDIRHDGFRCYYCNVNPIVGHRTMCTVCGCSFCEACEMKGLHTEAHPRLKFYLPVAASSGTAL